MNLITNVDVEKHKVTILDLIDYNDEQQTFKSFGFIEYKIEDLLYGLHKSNGYDIHIGQIKLGKDRKHEANIYTLPIFECIQYDNYDEACLLHTQGTLVLQKSGEYCIGIHQKSKIQYIRTYYVWHNIQDGTMPFYYDRKGQPTYSKVRMSDLAQVQQCIHHGKAQFDGCKTIVVEYTEATEFM